jgi:xanthosine utilization system XapX-like protein
MQAALSSPYDLDNVPQPASGKPMWAVIGVLGVCAMAIGASLVHVVQRPAEPVATSFAPDSSPAALGNFGNALTEKTAAPSAPQAGGLAVDAPMTTAKPEPMPLVAAPAATPAKAAATKPSTRSNALTTQRSRTPSQREMYNY